VCPASGDDPVSDNEALSHSRISYDYYMGRPANSDPRDILLSDWQVDTLPKKKGALLFSFDGGKPGNNHEKAGGNLLSCDGAVVFSAPKADQDLLFPSTVRLLGP
jgi:hypothetical protein